MRTIKKEDFEQVFLVFVRPASGHRKHLPFIRRHFKSVLNICSWFDITRPIDVYYSGVLVYERKAGSKELRKTAAYRLFNSSEPDVFQVAA